MTLSIRASLTIYSNDLDPAAITQVLGIQCTPRIRSPRSRDPSRLARRASYAWVLEAPRDLPLEGQIQALASQILPRVAQLRGLSLESQQRLLIGVFLESDNETLSFTPAALQLLSDLSLEVDLDIYYAPQDSK